MSQFREMIAQPQSVCPWQWRQTLPFHPPSFLNSLTFPPKITLLNKPCRSRSSSNNNPKLEEENSFFDEDGVVQDMDGYLNHLSLEYDSIWDTKPSWCQPWTITLTGVLIITSSWVLLHSNVVTAGVSTLICAWWYIFLYSYPKAYSDMIAERRNKVTSGIEDTYGVRQSKDL